LRAPDTKNPRVASQQITAPGGIAKLIANVRRFGTLPHGAFSITLSPAFGEFGRPHWSDLCRLAQQD
jgi:hypothetical protein